MICYILNKYNANKTVEFSGHWTRVLWLMENAGFNKSNAKVTIETLHDPEGPLNTEEGKGWFEQWDGHWGEVMKETKNEGRNLIWLLTYEVDLNKLCLFIILW